MGYFLWCMPIENFHQQRRDSLRYNRIAIHAKMQRTSLLLAANPHAALASLYEVLVSVQRFGGSRERARKVYQLLIPIQPIREISKLFYQPILRLIYRLHDFTS